MIPDSSPQSQAGPKDSVSTDLEAAASSKQEAVQIHQEEQRLEDEATRSLGKENRQILILVSVIASFMLLAHFTPLRGWIENVQAWKGYVREFGLWAHLTFGTVVALAVMIGIPRLPLCAAAGLIFGFGQGVAISLISSTLGSYGTFVTARFGGRKAALARAENLGWLKHLLQRPSLARVFWVRQIMVPGVVLNVLLGLTSVKHPVFLLGTALGYLPLNIAFALGGSSIGKNSLGQTIGQLLGAIAVVNIVGFIVWRVVKKHREQDAQADKPDAGQ
ncbi:MAG: VTT domain-containing protein [Verrucomicrobiales bacterium]|nr:VTT domain-containing protein [Verrucomicrobiales bacterium]MCP5557835.1 VTT domain-containing protein [Verrucomicrobiaceae bacterium]